MSAKPAQKNTTKEADDTSSSDSSLQQQNSELQRQITALQQQGQGQQGGQQQNPFNQVVNGRPAPIRQSRILDRPPKTEEKDSALKIRIELDLEVEVDLYARVKGDVMIGLM